MCGIVGYLGSRDTVEVLLEGLQRLEYRGYDSAGVAIQVDGRIEVIKTQGKLSFLRDRLAQNKPIGESGIGHTRWATHGPPSVPNSHPHTDCKGHIAVVHNGIIENYLELREKLQDEGHAFRSQTDTEVIPHLLEKYYKGDLERAMQRALKDVRGSYAAVALTDAQPGLIVAARLYSPLVAGLGNDENFIASDIPAILSFTRNAYLIDNGEMIVATRQGIDVKTIEGVSVKKPVFQVNWDAKAAEKGGNKHFMIKEIFEQPDALRQTVGQRIKGHQLDLSETKLAEAFLKRMKKAVIIACGTASYAGMAGGLCHRESLRRSGDRGRRLRVAEPRVPVRQGHPGHRDLPVR